MDGFKCVDCGDFFATWERSQIHSENHDHKIKKLVDPEREMENKELRYRDQNEGVDDDWEYGEKK